MFAFLSICLGLMVLHQKAAIRQCDIHHIHHPQVEDCSLFPHSWLMTFDCQGSAAHKGGHTNNGYCWGSSPHFGVSQVQGLLEGGWEQLWTVRVLPIINLLVCMCVQLREQQKRPFMMLFGVPLDVFANKKLRKQWHRGGRGTLFYWFLYLLYTITLELFSHSHQLLVQLAQAAISVAPFC